MNYNRKRITSAARMLRKNMTKEEKHLWYDFLKGYPVKFMRQKVFGRYILDFYCASVDLVIELDGSQHYSEVVEEYDKKRTAYLNSFNLQVLRIPNNVIFSNFRGVCEYIDLTVKQLAKVKLERKCGSLKPNDNGLIG